MNIGKGTLSLLISFDFLFKTHAAYLSISAPNMLSIDFLLAIVTIVILNM
jgi:hypothetical protein